MIGSYLLKHFHEQFPDVEIRCLARSIPPHSTHFKVEWMPGDLLSEADCKEFVDDLDVVVHLAQANNPASSDRHWPGDHATNGLLTLNLLQALRERGGSPVRFLYASSGGSIYGNWQGRPFREEDACQPLSPYGIQKLTTEHYIHLAVEQGWLTAGILRIANAYGVLLPAERRQGLIGVAIHRAVTGLPIKVFGSQETVRDYVHLEDLARAFWKTLTYSGSFLLCNIGSGKGYSTKRVLEMVEKASGMTLQREMTGYGETAFTLTPQVVLGIEKARVELDWAPRIPLQKGIEQMWTSAQASMAFGNQE